jgi:hypothetical protein
MTFAMQCPECEADVDDIEVSVTEGSRTEHFWGAPVSVDECECEVDHIPECDECGKRTIEPEEAEQHYWDRVA